MQTLAYPERNITLQEALTCYCGHVLYPPHDLRKYPVTGVGTCLYCEECDSFCVKKPKIPMDIPKAKVRYGTWRRNEHVRYYRRRNKGHSAECAFYSHNKCSGFRYVSGYTGPRIRCSCPCHEGG